MTIAMGPSALLTATGGGGLVVGRSDLTHIRSPEVGKALGWEQSRQPLDRRALDAWLEMKRSQESSLGWGMPKFVRTLENQPLISSMVGSTGTAVWVRLDALPQGAFQPDSGSVRWLRVDLEKAELSATDLPPRVILVSEIAPGYLVGIDPGAAGANVLAISIESPETR